MKEKAKDALLLTGYFMAMTALSGSIAAGISLGLLNSASEDTSVTVSHIASDCQEALDSSRFSSKRCMIDTDKGTFSLGHSWLSSIYGDKQKDMLDQMQTGKTYNIRYAGAGYLGKMIFKLTPAD